MGTGPFAGRHASDHSNIFNIDRGEDGTVPSFGQLPQPSMQPLTDHFRSLCAKMAVATEMGTTYDDVLGSDLGIDTHFMNPAMPTPAQQTDSSIKIASVVEGFSDTDTFWELNGFDSAQRKRIRRELRLVRGQNVHLFDREHCFPGIGRYIREPDEWHGAEVRTYGIETEKAQRAGYNELVDRLRDNLETDLMRRGGNN